MKLEIGAVAPEHRDSKVITGRDKVSVLLDGIDITRHCRAVDFRIAVDSIVTATIEFQPDELIVNADVLAIKKKAALPDVTQEFIVNVVSDAIMRNMGGLRNLLRYP